MTLDDLELYMGLNFQKISPDFTDFGRSSIVSDNNARRIRAILACFCVARVCQRELGFLVSLSTWAVHLCVLRLTYTIRYDRRD